MRRARAWSRGVGRIMGVLGKPCVVQASERPIAADTMLMFSSQSSRQEWLSPHRLESLPSRPWQHASPELRLLRQGPLPSPTHAPTERAGRRNPAHRTQRDQRRTGSGLPIPMDRQRKAMVRHPPLLAVQPLSPNPTPRALTPPQVLPLLLLGPLLQQPLHPRGAGRRIQNPRLPLRLPARPLRRRAQHALHAQWRQAGPRLARRRLRPGRARGAVR